MRGAGSIPQAGIGIVGSLLVTETAFSIQAFMGVIVRGGLVVNNAILLVDYTNILRRRDGVPLREAVERAGRTRLPPVLMTTTTTLLGMVPMALGIGSLRNPQGEPVRLKPRSKTAEDGFRIAPPLRLLPPCGEELVRPVEGSAQRESPVLLLDTRRHRLPDVLALRLQKQIQLRHERASLLLPLHPDAPLARLAVEHAQYRRTVQNVVLDLVGVPQQELEVETVRVSPRPAGMCSQHGAAGRVRAVVAVTDRHHADGSP